MLEHALGLLGAFQKIADLAGGSDTNQKFLAEQEGQLIAHLHLAGVRRRNGQNIVAQFKRHEVVAEHQVCGDGAKQFCIDPLFPKIDEHVAVSFGEFARKLAFVLFVTLSWQPRRRRKLFDGGHDPLLRRPHHGERKDG